MSNPDYLSKIGEVSAKYGIGQNLEHRLRSLWGQFEEEAAKFNYDILGIVPASFRNLITEFISTLYQTKSGIPDTDCDQILAKDAEYGASWCKRGGTGAFHALARKGDRLINQLDEHSTLSAARVVGLQEAIDDTLGDLRRYLVMVEAWHMAREMTPEKLGEMIAESRTPICTCGPDGTDRFLCRIHGK
jgi:hypothetical protein